MPTAKSVFVARSNKIDPNLKDPRNDEIMFAFQREVNTHAGVSIMESIAV